MSGGGCRGVLCGPRNDFECTGGAIHKAVDIDIEEARKHAVRNCASTSKRHNSIIVIVSQHINNNNLKQT